MAAAHSPPSPQATMHAWRITSAAGGVHKAMALVDDASTPTSPPKPGFAVIRVHTTTINPVDHKLAELPIVGGLLIGKGMIPGKDFSGIVVSITSTGSTSEDIQPGTMVFGTLEAPNRSGTLAEFLTTPIANITPVPSGLSPDLAAAAPTVALTAYQSLMPYLPVPGNEEASNKKPQVFINGGSGGTGTFCIQIAKHVLGAHVVTSCSAANVAFCESLGADEVLDYGKVNISSELASRGEVFEHVVDNVGTPLDLFTAANHFLKPGGTFVQVGAGTNLSTLFNVLSKFLWPGFLGGGKRKFVLLGMKADRGETELKEIGKWMAEGKIKLEVDQRFSFKEANKAVERVKTGRVRGKVLISLNET